MEQKALLQKLAHSEKLSSLGEIVSGVAHELNNPLTAIMGFSDLLLDKDLPEMAKKQLKMINDASQRSKRIIDNLLTFARAYKPEKKYNNLNSVITGTIDLKDYQLKVNSIDVELNLDPSLPKTMLDEHQLQQVFLNIINNAQHAVAEKGIGGRISINTTFDDKIIRATVSDTGKGIPEGRLKKIFDPFFTTKEVGAGTGLGLSISYGIIREHGGNIYATSRPGQGATFIIELPIIKAPEDSSPAATSKKSRLSKKGNRALVLDDEELILSLINEVLVDSGFHVDTAVSGDVALRLLSNQTYDLIISDFKMPGMNGKEFYHKVKSMKPDAANKIIFISGDSVSDGTQTFLKDTGNLFLKKPFTLEGPDEGHFKTYLGKFLISSEKRGNLMKSKPWSGRFTEDTNQFVEDFTASISFDKRLYRQDIIGSIAHAIMLGEQGVITKAETNKIIKGLQGILKDIESDNFEFLTEFEDIHMNIEKRLIERIGDAGRKLHTARSRNDQVALDIRFYLRDEIQAVYDYAERLQDSLVSLAKTNIDVVMPGYTHLQRAQPVLFSHHMLAYYEMLERDKGRLEDCLKRLNVSPIRRRGPCRDHFPD